MSSISSKGKKTQYLTKLVQSLASLVKPLQVLS
jgi:hypothetical protein